MNHLRIPREIKLFDTKSKEFSWSAGMYRRVEIPTSATKPISSLISGFNKGSDPGSLYYIKNSTHHFIRTKALQEHSYLLYPKGDAIIPINPKVFENLDLSDSDILLSKDSNVGECALVDGNKWKNCMFSGGIVRLKPHIDPYYLFAFLKHPLFKTQLLSMVPRGATIAHANTLWLDCHIPFPNQNSASEIISYVAALTKVIAEKEIAIRERNEQINRTIEFELKSNQRGNEFRYTFPTNDNVKTLGRFDAAIYGQEYKSKVWLILNYVLGYRTPSESGFTIIPGPSLEMKLLKTRIDSDLPKPGFYALFIPTNISEYGTMTSIPWMGTAKKLPLLRKGDVLFGEAGFHKGRSIVLIEQYDRGTTNAHGLYARRDDEDLEMSIFFRCIFNWYRSQRLIDLMAVGGSGGHFSPEYFDYVLIPQFPDDIRRYIAKLYHSPAPKPNEQVTLDNFVEWHRIWNEQLGIWELDREMRSLRQTLFDVQEKIINGKNVNLPLDTMIK